MTWSNGDGGMSIERPVVNDTVLRRPHDRHLAPRTTV